MKVRFLSRDLDWRRVGMGLLIGVVILFVVTLVFVVLVENGWLTQQV